MSYRWAWVVMIVIVAGVSGCGKTTVGRLLGQRLGWPFVDGDSLHPPANVAKMASGVALTDEDRKPWLAAIGEWMDARLAREMPGVVACSALRRAYRDTLLDGRPCVRMAFLLIDQHVVANWMAARKGHFFTAQLLGSQFAVLEPPAADEPQVVPVPVRGRPGDVAEEIVMRLHLTSATGGPADQPSGS